MAGENNGFDKYRGRQLSNLEQDRYIQNIVSQAQNLSTNRDFELPRISFGENDEDSSSGRNQQVACSDHDVVDQLDDFDRQLLGLTNVSADNVNSCTVIPRVSLPVSDVASSRRPRIIDDASHHFRPFAPESEGQYHPSQFASNPIYPGNINQLNPSPASRPIFDRDGSHRIAEVHWGSQLVTPPMYTAAHGPSPQETLTSSSPLVGGSSPSTRLSIRKPEPRAVLRPATTNLLLPSARVRLSLDHAPSRVTPKVAGCHLVDPRAALPDKCRTIFPYELFNTVQSRCFPHVFGSVDNVVVSAPTGSGKTAILEMAICKLVTTPGGENYKVVYQAPTKSLCSERAKDWEKKFRHLNLQCVELTGSTSPGQARRVGSASIIVTTPEKWDSITRKWADHQKLLGMVRLVLIDEVHILKDVRGATLEAVVSRMKTSGANVRFIALSATVPNLDDIATWLGRDHVNQHEPARRLSFGEEMRPVKLKKYVHGYDFPGNDFVFEKSLDGKLHLLLGKHAQQKPIMVFCFTRKACEQTAQKLAEWWSTRIDDKPWPGPTQQVPIVNKELHELVRYGVAFHHAGLDAQDRSSVEENYLNGQLHVICCTSTLAVGVNLPCHTVVLKGTSAYTDNGLQEYSDLEVMQMLGRAGRPQFDRSATAIIMTKQCNAERYDKMMSGQEVLESKLHLNLIEHLNSEIGLGTIHNLETAKKWITGTFLYVRIQRSPNHYHTETASADTNYHMNPDDWVSNWCARDIEMLQSYNLVTGDSTFKCTEYGMAMSRYMIQFDTMKQLLDIPPGCQMEQLLISLSQTADFQDLRFKPQEKTILRAMNSAVIFPVSGQVSDVWHKVHLLVQINLASLELPSQKDANMVRRQLAIEKNVIFDRINRLIRCMIDCKVSDGDAISVRSGLELARAIAANAWEDHPAQLQQVSGLGPVTMRKFLSYGIRSIQDLAGQSFVDIERIASRNPPFGKNMLKSLQDFPRLQMTPEIVSRNGRSYTRFEDAVRVAINVKLHYTNTKVPTWGGKLPVVTFMAETTDGRLANFWRGSIKKLSEVNDFELRFFVALSAPGEKITCYFSCEEIVGTQVTKLLSPDVPSNAFQGLPRCRGATALGSDLHQRPDDGIIDGDLADEDMLDVLGTANIDEPQHVNSQPRSEGLLEEFEVEFPDIEDVVDTMMDHIDEEKTPTAPIQMANGKWKCNHQCAGGAPTKNGKQCSHRCCHEGLDRPRPAPRKKEKNAVHKIRSIPEDMTTIRSMSEASQRTVKPNERKTQPKRQLSESSATKNRAAVKKPRTQARFNDDDIKCIDLSAVTDDEEKSKMYIPKGPADLKKAQKKLTDLHDRIEPHGESSSRPTKPGRTLGFNGKALKHPEENAHADFDGDILGDDDEDLPELEYLLRSAEDSQALEASQVLANDDALRSTAPNTHGKNKDSGHWPSLSFITAAASEKASYHPNRSRQSKPNSDPALSQEETVPKIQSHNDLTADMSAPMNLTSELEGSLSDTDLASSILNTADRTIEPLLLDSEISDSLTTIHIPLTPLPNALATPLPGEPPWVGEYNQDLINMLRGTVEFVD